jgi:hypothetical protein
VPPAVALLNYISSAILWRIFCQTGIFAGFSLRMYDLIAGRINAAAMAWDIIFFSLAGPVGDYTGAHTVIFRLQGCDGWGKGRGILYIKSLGGFFLSIICRKISEAAMCGPEVGGTLFFAAPR